MKRISFLLVLAFMELLACGQGAIPNVDVKDLQGKTVNIKSIVEQHSLVVLSFWATWCKPCHQELNTFADLYDEWKDETGMEIIAVSTDDIRASSKVKSLVAGNDWPFIVFIDENAALKRALNVTNIPYLLVIKDGKVIHKHVGYTPGSEMELYNVLRKNSNK